MQNMQKNGGSSNTTMTQFGIKVKIFLWIILFVAVMILSVATYDKDHKVLMTVLPIATAIPCAINVNKNMKKLNEAKEAEKIYVSRRK